MRLKTVFFILGASFFCVHAAWAEPVQKTSHNSKTVNRAFTSDEKLTYSVSWSRLVEAGIAVMEVKDGRTADGRRMYRFLVRTNSVGILETVYPVRDSVESVIDADEMCSLSYSLQESHGTRKRQRRLTLDRKNNTVQVITNNGAPETYPVPERVQDALSSLYYVRTVKDFVVGKPLIVDVFDSDKTWAVEIQVLGKERIKTPAGEFDTIKVKTYPKYEGVFMNKGEIYIWLTDDARKIPVLMQSTISIGSIVSTLIKIEGRKDTP